MTVLAEEGGHKDLEKIWTSGRCIDSSFCVLTYSWSQLLAYRTQQENAKQQMAFKSFLQSKLTNYTCIKKSKEPQRALKYLLEKQLFSFNLTLIQYLHS